jgi:hypothetical protein
MMRGVGAPVFSEGKDRCGLGGKVVTRDRSTRQFWYNV